MTFPERPSLISFLQGIRASVLILGEMLSEVQSNVMVFRADREDRIRERQQRIEERRLARLQRRAHRQVKV